MNNDYQTIEDSELEDFDTICRNHGINKSEFDIQEHDVDWPQQGIGSIHGKITISRNGNNKTYVTGNLSRWVVDFENDLNKGFFD